MVNFGIIVCFKLYLWGKYAINRDFEKTDKLSNYHA